MPVFISSTVYDLIDIRAELTEQLKTIGITPALSDDKLSDFRVQHAVNSIGTCPVNVESSDEFLLVLDRRYGPTLEKSGYDKASATHLEYRRAIEKNIPVRVYVRDRLEADSTTSNWYSTFTHSIDLKAAITKHFDKWILPERLVEAIQNNVFPLFNIEVEASPFSELHKTGAITDDEFTNAKKKLLS